MPTKIFVGNLSSDTTGEDLRPLFEQYGQVVECDVLRNFGFVHMQIEQEADQAIDELSGTVIKGQRINVEKSTGSSRGGRGGGGKMGGSRGGGRGRGAPRGRGSYGRGSDRDPYDPYPPPPRSHPYSRDPYPYDYYDRPYPGERLPPPPRHPDDRRLAAYDREDRLPPPRDPYDRYPPARYPPRPDPYAAYDRYAPPRSAADPYERPPPDYYSRYRAYDGYDDPPRRPAEGARAPPPAPRAANGYEDRRPEAEPAIPGSESFSSSYTSYYDRFYSKTAANGAEPLHGHGSLPPAGGRGAAPLGRGGPTGGARNDQQAALQTGPIYF